MNLDEIKAQEEALNLHLLRTRAEEASKAGIQWTVEPDMILGLVKAVVFWRDEFERLRAENERLKAKTNRLIDALDGADHLSYHPELADRES